MAHNATSKAKDDAKSHVSRAREAVQDDADVKKAEALVKDGEKKAKEFQETLNKGVSFDDMKKIANNNADPKLMAAMEQAQKLASNENADIGDMATMAAAFGQQAGLKEEHQKILQAFGGVNQEVDTEAAAKIPGLIVDKETGKISVLGLINLDARDPMSKVIANGLLVANNFVMLSVNARLFEKSYQGGSWLANQFDLTKASKHRIGYAAALATTAGTSFWPTFNGYLQCEKESRKDVMALANKFAPMLDDYDRSHASRVSKLYRITPDQNALIYNERRRMGQEHNADRLRLGIEAIGQVPLYVASIIDGSRKLPELQQQAENAARIEQFDNSTQEAEAAYWKELGDKAKFIEKESGGVIKGDKALEMAKERLDPATHAAKIAGKKEKGGFFGELGEEMKKGVVTVAAPFFMRMVGQNLYKQRLDECGYQPVSASDMIFSLRKQLDDNPKADRYALPKGMSIPGAKDGNNHIKLEEYVEQIFRQHQRDSHGPDALIPARYEERIDEASKLIAKACREGRLDGLALVKLVGEQKIVRDRGKSVAEEDIVKQEIQRLEHEMRHVEYVDRERYFAESSFTAPELKASWDGMDAEEREVFSLMVPPQVLESVGVDTREIQQLREKRQDRFYEDLAQISQSLQGMGEDTLKQLGMTNEESKLFKNINSAIKDKGMAKWESSLERENISRATHAVTNLIVASKQHEGTLQELMAQRQT